MSILDIGKKTVLGAGLLCLAALFVGAKPARSNGRQSRRSDEPVDWIRPLPVLLNSKTLVILTAHARFDRNYPEVQAWFNQASADDADVFLERGSIEVMSGKRFSFADLPKLKTGFITGKLYGARCFGISSEAHGCGVSDSINLPDGTAVQLWIDTSSDRRADIY